MLGVTVTNIKPTDISSKKRMENYWRTTSINRVEKYTKGVETTTQNKEWGTTSDKETTQKQQKSKTT